MHFIVTNRRIDENDRIVERLLGSDEIDHSPNFRVARFLPDSTPGSDLTQRVHFIPDATIRTYAPGGEKPVGNTYVGTAAMFYDLRASMCEPRPDGRTDRHTLVFIHGYNTSWIDSLETLQRLHDIYVLPEASPIEQIVMLSWPSAGRTFLPMDGVQTAYSADRERVIDTAAVMARLFRKVSRFFVEAFTPRIVPETGELEPVVNPCDQPIHLLAHSMGNQVLEALIADLERPPADRFPLFREMLLVNADIDWTSLESHRPLHRLPEYAERITVYNHDGDKALRISETTKNREKRLGRQGPLDIERICARTLVVDQSDHGGLTGSNHSLFLESAAVIEDVTAVFNGYPSDAIRSRQKRHAKIYNLSPLG